jgi:hypothetical protein
MNIRRLVLDVDKARERPSLLEIAQTIQGGVGVEVLNLTVDGIDIETVGMDITVEGERLDYDEILKAIESTGTAVHGIGQVVAGNRIIERVPWIR